MNLDILFVLYVSDRLVALVYVIVFAYTPTIDVSCRIRSSSTTKVVGV